MSQPIAEQVAEVFESYPQEIRLRLLELRKLIFTVAEETDGVGPLTETLKWGQPSYLTSISGSGTTVRIDRFCERDVAIFVHCQTTLISDFRGFFPELDYSGTRAIVCAVGAPLPVDALRLFIEMALTYKRTTRCPTTRRKFSESS